MRTPSGPGDPRALGVHRARLVRKAEVGELETIRAKRVRLDHVRAGAHVLPMHLGNQIRLCEIQLVETAVEKDALGVEHRAHRPIADENALIESL
jgi:hypothetical protein